MPISSRNGALPRGKNKFMSRYMYHLTLALKKKPGGGTPHMSQRRPQKKSHDSEDTLNDFQFQIHGLSGKHPKIMQPERSVPQTPYCADRLCTMTPTASYTSNNSHHCLSHFLACSELWSTRHQTSANRLADQMALNQEHEFNLGAQTNNSGAQILNWEPEPVQSSQQATHMQSGLHMPPLIFLVPAGRATISGRSALNLWILGGTAATERPWPMACGSWDC